MPPEIDRVYTWTLEDAITILRQAKSIADDLCESPAEWEVIFPKAVEMLTHHIPMPKNTGVSLPGGIITH